VLHARGVNDRGPAAFGIDPQPLPDVTSEAERVARAAVVAGLEMRLMGGVAIWLTSPSVRRSPLERSYGDFDLAVTKRDARACGAFLEAAGYIPEKMFNALHGATRLNFRHPDGSWPVDVVIDEVRMSHRIDLRGRLGGPGPTLTLADLLLTKLQVWEINHKDLGDILGLLADHELADREDPDTIDRRRITMLSAADWGLCHTIERNLRGTLDELALRAPDEAPHEVGAQVRALLDAIAAAPKSVAWKARARVGERVRWYETPEEVRH
jgi:hypothetical protein